MSNPIPTDPAAPTAIWEDQTFDFFKHLTTLNFAAIGFLMVLIERDNLVKVPKEQAFQVAFFWFGGSLLGSFIMMVCLMRPMTFKDKDSEAFCRFIVNALGFCAVAAFIWAIYVMAVVVGIVVPKPA